MAITNGYATLAQVKQAMDIANTYTALTISFTDTVNTITDTAYGLRRFQDKDIITIDGSTSNDGIYTIAAGGNTPGTFTVAEALTTEAAGDTVIITVIQDQKDDGTIERAVEAASRDIDGICGTRFYRNAADETRYYPPVDMSDGFFCPDDIGSITTLKTDEDGDGTFETTWTVTTDYILTPYNAIANSTPFTGIETTINGSYHFPRSSRNGRDYRAIQLVGKFGYNVTGSYPAEVNEACIEWAQRLLKRKDAPLGVMGSQAMGFVRLEHAIDPDIEQHLMKYTTRRAYG